MTFPEPETVLPSDGKRVSFILAGGTARTPPRVSTQSELIHKQGQRQILLRFSDVPHGAPPPLRFNTSCRGESAQPSHHKWPLKADLPSKPPRFRFVAAEPQATHSRLCFLRLTSCVFDQKRYALGSSTLWNAVAQDRVSFLTPRALFSPPIVAPDFRNTSRSDRRMRQSLLVGLHARSRPARTILSM